MSTATVKTTPAAADIIARPGIAPDLEGKLLSLHGRLQRFIGSAIDTKGAGHSFSQVVDAAGVYAQALAGTIGKMADRDLTMNIGASAARAVCGELLTDAELNDAFWGSELGRAVAWWIGGPGVYVQRSHAMAILGCTRQNIAGLVESGSLRELGDPGDRNRVVTSESLMALMRSRYPLVP